MAATPPAGVSVPSLLLLPQVLSSGCNNDVTKRRHQVMAIGGIGTGWIVTEM